MDATTAATKSKVTVATIRTWCRTGVVTAVKTAGRWDIDTQSLRAHRRRLIALRLARQNRAAARVHAGITAQLTLPALTGTPKQIAWATDIRDRTIATTLVLVTHDDETEQPADHRSYRLATGHTLLDRDPLNAAEVIGKTAYTEHANQADYVAALDRVLAARTDARYWITRHR